MLDFGRRSSGLGELVRFCKLNAGHRGDPDVARTYVTHYTCSLPRVIAAGSQYRLVRAAGIMGFKLHARCAMGQVGGSYSGGPRGGYGGMPGFRARWLIGKYRRLGGQALPQHAALLVARNKAAGVASSRAKHETRCQAGLPAGIWKTAIMKRSHAGIRRPK